MSMDNVQRKLLEEVAGLHEVPQGAYSLRVNGQLHGKNSSENIELLQKMINPVLIYTLRRERRMKVCIFPLYFRKAVCENSYTMTFILERIAT